MSRLNYLDRDPISFVCFLWRATANLVRGLRHASRSPPCLLSFPQCPPEVSTLSNPKKTSPTKFRVLHYHVEM